MPKGIKMGSVEDLKNRFPTATIIKFWDELEKLGESDTHILEMNNRYSAILTPKNPEKHRRFYLTSHTFYEKHFVYSTKLLQKCGFNVIISPVY